MKRFLRRLIILSIIASFLISLTGCGPISQSRYDRQFQKAVELRQQGDLTGAVASLTQALAVQPGSLEALLLRGEILLDQSKYGEAAADLEGAAKADPSSARALALCGQAHYGMGEPEEALEDLSQAIQLNGQDFTSRYYRGLALYQKGDYAAALEDLNQAVALRPDDSEAYYQRALTQVELGDWQAARIDLNNAANYSPGDAAVYFQRGLVWMKLEDPTQAIADFDKSLELDPNQPEAAIQRGLSRMALEQFDQAVADFSRAMEIDPTGAEAYFGRARAYLRLEEVSAALADLDEAVRLDPALAEAYYQRGLIRMRNNDYPAAAADFNQSLRLDWGNQEAHFQRGMAYLRNGEIEKAARSFGVLVELNPEYQEAYRWMGQAHMQLEDYPAAVADMDKAIEAEPGEMGFYTLRGSAYFLQDQLDRALGDFRKASQIQVDSPTAIFNLGLVNARKGESEAAISTFSRAIDLQPMAEAYRARGDLYYDQQEYGKAAEDYQAALALDPSQTGILLQKAAAAFLHGDLQTALDSSREYLEKGEDIPDQSQVEEWSADLESELDGNAAIDLFDAVLSDAKTDGVKEDCDFKDQVLDIKNELRDSTEEYATSFCVLYADVYVLGHITRMPTQYDQYIFDQDLQRAEADLAEDEDLRLPEFIKAVGDAFHGQRETEFYKGDKFYWYEIQFRRGMVGVHLTILHDDDLLLGFNLVKILQDVDSAVVQALLAGVPAPTGGDDLKNITPIYD